MRITECQEIGYGKKKHANAVQSIDELNGVIATGTVDGVLKLWFAKQCFYKVKLHKGTIWTVRLYSSTVLTTGSDNKVCVVCDYALANASLSQSKTAKCDSPQKSPSAAGSQKESANNTKESANSNKESASNNNEEDQKTKKESPKIVQLRNHTLDAIDAEWLGTKLVTAGYDGKLHVYSDYALQRTISLDRQIKGIKTDPFNEYLAIRIMDGLLILDASLKTVYEDAMHFFYESDQFYTRIGWLPNGSYLCVPDSLIQDSPSVLLFARGSWSCKRIFYGHMVIAPIVAISKHIYAGSTHSSLIATSSADSQLVLWRTDTPHAIVVIKRLFVCDLLELAWTGPYTIVATSTEGDVRQISFTEEELAPVLEKKKEVHVPYTLQSLQEEIAESSVKDLYREEIEHEQHPRTKREVLYRRCSMHGTYVLKCVFGKLMLTQGEIVVWEKELGSVRCVSLSSKLCVAYSDYLYVFKMSGSYALPVVKPNRPIAMLHTEDFLLLIVYSSKEFDIYNARDCRLVSSGRFPSEVKLRRVSPISLNNMNFSFNGIVHSYITTSKTWIRSVAFEEETLSDLECRVSIAKMNRYNLEEAFLEYAKQLVKNAEVERAKELIEDVMRLCPSTLNQVVSILSKNKAYEKILVFTMG